ncbi:type I-B CRISPR-associated protein Cas8b1/Cst1 [Dissulfurispira thermophila]|uniref:Type I-B CRISPR-associated protein Cas8b1/Cst1 n=1 Tax=Dissulfurispira thermophila TaxID=2715679 RepID=A0A7G1H3W5_9BACT|nr:type I-B CRISPR-associated protein Cas8b1/Cst1 [Dissulfurispira thermophila]BCB96813.1 type I-B CRISPR-associated protein Cas8b1/Cst1 [Dissulfurispira thermophila]
MKHKIYLRDWYFNAGIIGFLTIAADGRGLDSISSLSINENFIEFENDIFEGFEEKFIKYAFIKFFNVQAYVQRLQKAQKEVTDKKTKIKPEQMLKKIEEIEKSPYKDFLKLLNIPISEYKSVEDFINNLENAKNTIKALPKEQIFKILSSSPEGRASLQNFISWRFKGICSSDNISEYINKMKSTNQSKKLKNNDLCLSCQERKAEYEFNNAISNIIGFNKDNSNWIWGFKPSKLKICPLCAIIYNCAFASFAYVLKSVDGEYLNYFYFPNENTKVSSLFEAVMAFNLMLDNIEDNSNLLYAMIRQTIRHIAAKQSNNIAENINFIEIADNPILAGQSSKGYNIYNYNISYDIARFLDMQFSADSIPRGSYVIKNTYYSIEEELLKLTIEQQLGYSALYRYYVYALFPERYNPRFNLNKVTAFVVKYIQWIRGENMEKSQKIVNKGFISGINLRNELLKKNKENQINGLVYGFLNDLKIADREKFLDKYIRIIMSHNLPNYFGKDEMLDDDYFLQFGYSFINGLMSKENAYEAAVIDNSIEEGN